MNKCSYCGEDTNNHWSFVSMSLPVPDMEEKIDKWGRSNWWEHMERTDLTEDEIQELDQLSFYNQALNTVGRGYQCDGCYELEGKLYNKYYPENK